MNRSVNHDLAPVAQAGTNQSRGRTGGKTTRIAITAARTTEIAALTVGTVERRRAVASPPGPDHYEAGVLHLRDTAKWITTIFAALGAVLIAGTQVSNIGSLEWGPRLWVALVTGALALTAIGRIIWVTVRVLTAGEVTIEDIASEPTGSKQVAWLRRHGLLQDYANAQEILDAIDRDFATSEDLWAHPTDENKAARAQIGKQLRYLHRVADTLLSGARYFIVREQFRHALKETFVLGAATAFLAVCFVWAANPEPMPDPEAEGGASSIRRSDMPGSAGQKR